MPTDPGSEEVTDHPNVVVMPPLLYAVALIVGVAAQFVVAIHLPVEPEFRWVVGGLLVVGGIAVALGFSRAFARIGQDRNPNTPTPSIITSGVYRYSRNPAYVSLTAILLGIGLLLDNGWILLAAIPVVVVMHNGVILREEAYLERTFGDEYRNYKMRVRRWL
jgi:protein-S-isoprenylcysteine O-methyltransferase Ste14